MAEKTIHFKIITPEKVVFEDDVNSITAQGVQGSFGILPNHVPFMSALAVDTAKAVKDGQEFIFSIIGGAFQFRNNEAIILSKVAELGDDIDTARAKQAKEEAEKVLDLAKNEAEIKRANMAIAKAMARLKAASKK